MVFLPVCVDAAVFEVGEDVAISSQESISENIYIGSGSALVSSIVEKDLVGAGGEILITGDVKEDLFLLGGSVNVLGDISGDARIVGGNVVIGGEVSGDLIVFGGSVKILPEAMIDGEVKIWAGNISWKGTTKESISLYAEKVEFSGIAQKNVFVEAESISIKSDAKIEGDLNYKSFREAKIENSQSIVGSVNFEQSEKIGSVAKKGILAGVFFGILGTFAVLKFVAILILALILVSVFKKCSKEITTTCVSSFGKSLLVGLISFILFPIVSAVLFVSLVLMPIGIISILGFVIAIILSSAFMLVFFGAWLYKILFKTENYELSWKGTLLGAFVLLIIEFIPIVNIVFNIIVFLVTFGAFLKVAYTHIESERK